MRSISVAEQGRLRSNMRPSAPARQIPVKTGICQLNSPDGELNCASTAKCTSCAKCASHAFWRI